MTRYHFVPGKKRTSREDLLCYEEPYNEVNQAFARYKRTHTDKSRHAQSCADQEIRENKKKRTPIYYLEDDENGLSSVVNGMKSGDSIVLHAEGEPFVIGFSDPTKYDLYPHRLVDLFVNAGLLPQKEITLDLLACNSSVTYQGLNFARDTSILFAEKGYNVKVRGYTGLIVEKESKNGIKFTCVEDYLNINQEENTKINPENMSRSDSRKLKGCPINEAAVEYVNGDIVDQGLRGSQKPLTDAEKLTFGCWGDKYINTYRKGITESQRSPISIALKKEVLSELTSRQTLFKKELRAQSENDESKNTPSGP